MKFNRCVAGPVNCRYKANADRIIVCSAPLSNKVFPDGKTYKVPLDAKGGHCPFFSPVFMRDEALEEVIV